MTANALIAALPPGYGLILLEIILIAVHCTITGYAGVGTARRKIFTKAFFSTNFPELKDPPPGGYPDMGSGYYSNKLNHDDWFYFNSAQRAHYNYLENLTSTLVTVAIAGLIYTKITLIAGIVFMIGRALYGYGYTQQGPRGRRMGSRVAGAAQVIILILAIISCYELTGGYAGFMHLLRF